MGSTLEQQINSILTIRLELSQDIIERFIDIIKSEDWSYVDCELWRRSIPLPVPKFVTRSPRDFQLLRQTGVSGLSHYTCFVYERDAERAVVYDSSGCNELQDYQDELLRQRYGTDIAIQYCRTNPLQHLNSNASGVYAIAYATHLMCKGSLEDFETYRFGEQGMNELNTEMTLRQHLAKIFRMKRVQSFPCHRIQNYLTSVIAEEIDSLM